MVEPKDHQGVVPFSQHGMFGTILNRPQGYLCKTTFAVTDFLCGHLTRLELQCQRVPFYGHV